MLSLLIPGIGLSINGYRRSSVLAVVVLLALYASAFAYFLGSPVLILVWLLLAVVLWLAGALIQIPLSRRAARPPNSVWTAVGRGAVYILVLLVGLVSLNVLRQGDLFRYHTYTINNEAMAPAYVIGDQIVADMGFRAAQGLTVGDPVVLDNLATPRYLLKRVIAIGPGVLTYKDRVFRFNGKVVDDPFGDWSKAVPGTPDGADAYHLESLPEPVVLKDSQVFCVGDNRPYSKDSRFLGPLAKSQITGKVLYNLTTFE